MIVINIDKAMKMAEELKKKSSSSKELFKSLKILVPNKDNIIRKIVFLAIEIVFCVVVAKQINTIALAKDIFQVILSVVIALVAIVFTGYAIFQALINDKLLIALLSVENKDGNLYGTNAYFVRVMIFQIACLIMDVFIIILLIALPEEWVLFTNNTTNEICAMILLLFAVYCNIEGIWEMKSFIFNVFQMFNLHAYARMAVINEKNKS